MCVLMPCTSLYGSRDATINMLKLAERRPAIKQAHKTTMLDKNRDLSIDFCASLHRSADANANILKFAGRRPAMKRPHCSAMLGKIKNCVLTSSEAQPNATDAKKPYVQVQVSWASPCNETNSLFSYAGEKPKFVCRCLAIPSIAQYKNTTDTYKTSLKADKEGGG